jgi:hypothetical protein
VFAGRRVAVVGGGQSALESAALLNEAHADVEVFAREHGIRWLGEEVGDDVLGPQHYAYRKIAIGGPRSAWLAARPTLFRRLPYRMHERLVKHFVRPAGASWLRPRLSVDQITVGRSIMSASQHGETLVLELDDRSKREVDHVLLATGYQIDLARYPFLAPELVAGVHTRGGSPVLGAGYESSIHGLHFLGAPAARSFGPVMHFVCGTWASARGLARAVAGRRAPPTGFSW